MRGQHAVEPSCRDICWLLEGLGDAEALSTVWCKYVKHEEAWLLDGMSQEVHVCWDMQAGAEPMCCQQTKIRICFCIKAWHSLVAILTRAPFVCGLCVELSQLCCMTDVSHCLDVLCAGPCIAMVLDWTAHA